MLRLIIIISCLFVLLILGAGYYFSTPTNGKPFQNEVVKKQGFFRFAKWLITRSPGKWQTHKANSAYPKPPKRVDDGILITFVNHATVLIQMHGMNIITDPIWSERCSPVSFMGPKRVRPAGVRFEDLPPIDVVLISHNHYDHLDLPTLKKLQERDNPHIYAGLGTQVFLQKEGIAHTTDLDWWQSIQQDSLKITAVPAQHFSGRGLFDRNGTLWVGFIVSVGNQHIYFAGDTGLGPHFAEIQKRFGNMTVSLLPVGAFLPISIMGHVHMSPKEAVQAAQILGSQHNVGIHFGTFPLADDGEQEPAEQLKIALQETPLDFTMLDFGEARHYMLPF